MKTIDLENLFPERLRQAAIEYFEMKAFGAVLLRQLPVLEPGPGKAPDAESLDRSVTEFLHSKEIAQARSYRLLKRRNEFLAGRVSAKLALAEFWGTKGGHQVLPAVEIFNDSTGRPLVSITPIPNGKNGENPPIPKISISHGGAYGAALAADVPCGIDLQEQKDTLIRVLDKYCSAEEDRMLTASLPETTPLIRLSLLWTAKEAAKKACSFWWMPGFLDLQLDLPVQRKDGWYVLYLTVARTPARPIPHRLTVLATIFNQYGLAVCILNEARRHAGTAGS